MLVKKHTGWVCDESPVRFFSPVMSYHVLLPDGDESNSG